MSAIAKRDRYDIPTGLRILRDVVAHDTDRLTRSSLAAMAKPAKHETSILRIISAPAESLMEQA